MKTFSCRSLHALVVLACASLQAADGTAPEVEPPPDSLCETGLYANCDTLEIAATNLPFSPQYPLWSDGARKRRFIHLPKGTFIDASRFDAWQFPVGTRLWKEFSFQVEGQGGARTETRYMVHTASGWKFATYVWSKDARKAPRAPKNGVASVELAAGVQHQIPGEGDCRACHGNGSTPVLGFSALQLSPDRDPNAMHGELPPQGSLDLATLVATRRLRGWNGSAPRIPGPPTERAVLGYLHGNCGHCHRAEGAVASVGMVLASSGEIPPLALRTTVAQPSRFMAPLARIRAGDAQQSVLLARMRSRSPLEQMPPLGTQLVDDAAVRLIAEWIDALEHGGPT